MYKKLAHDLDKSRTEDVRLKDSSPFSNWLLKKPVKQGLESAGYKMATVIQASAIPVGKMGHDLLIQSKAGTGKTLIFCTILLENCLDCPGLASIIVAPTREIAIQIEEVLRRIARHCKKFEIVCAIGGTDITVERQLLQTANAVVGTPGRLVHLLESDFVRASNVKLLILDEADQLFGASHRKNIEKILNAVPAERQILACSATFCNELDIDLAKVMRNPLWISTKDKTASLIGIKQYVYRLPEKKPAVLEMEAKIEAVLQIFKRLPFKLCMVFTQSQSRAATYQSYLKKAGWECDHISGALEQSKRNEIFKRFCDFDKRILVSTDLMARGIDSEHVNLVINLEPPYDMVTYLHRVGRAGRFGSYGIAINILSTNADYERFEKIMSEFGSGGLKVHKFPDGEDGEDFWNPDTFKENFSNAEESLVLRDKHENEAIDDKKPNDNETESNIKILCSGGGESGSQLSINTNTFCINSKDSAVNILQTPPNSENKENFLLCQPEDTPTSNRSSMQLSANTIDDASSLAVDSQLSTQQDLLVPCPSLAMDAVEAKSAIFETEAVKTLPELHNLAEKELDSVNASLIEQYSLPEIVVANPKNDDVFALYSDYLENGDDVESNENTQHEMAASYGATTVAEDFTNEKQETSMQVLVDSTKVSQTDNETFESVPENKPKAQHADAGDSLIESQTNLDQTIGGDLTTNGSCNADSESSLGKQNYVNNYDKNLSSAYFFNDKSTKNATAVNHTKSDNIEINSETIIANKDSECEDTAENDDAVNDDGGVQKEIHNLWMKEYWKQVHFIHAYTKFLLDYSKKCNLD